MRTPLPARAALLVPLCLLAAAPLAAQSDARPRPAPTVERVYRLTQRPAAAAVERVCPLLSSGGSVEVHDNGRTLVVRDRQPIVDQVMAALAAFDRGGRTLRLAVRIVRAEAASGGAGAGEASLALPPEVVDRLRRLLRYRSYALLARAELEAREDEAASFEVGPEFRVSFRLDPLAEPDRVRIREFRVLRRTPAGELKPLVHTHLSLERGRPMILGLSPTEASERALIVVLQAAAEGGGGRERG